MLKSIKYLKPYFWQCLLIVLGVALQVYTALELPALSSDIMNKGVAESNMSFIFQTGLLMLGITALGSLGSIVSSYFSAKVSSRVSMDMRRDIFAKVMSLSFADVEKFSTASLITRTTGDIWTVQRTLIMSLTMMVRVPFMAIGAIIQAFRTAPNMTWIIAVSVAILFIQAAILISLAIPKFKVYQKILDKINSITRENLTGIKVIRALNKQKYEENKFERSNEKLKNTDICISKVMAFQQPVVNLVFNLSAVLIIFIGVSNLHTDMSYLGRMIAFSQYSAQVLMSFLFLTFLFVMIPRGNVSSKRISEVLETKSQITFKDQMTETPSEVPSVEFKHVTFSYGKKSEAIIEDISFVARAGQTTAFIGSTGSGKSTLINLVSRFFDATEGEVLINNLNIKEYTENALMDKIGYVPQKGYLFTGTVRSNILYGVENLKKSELDARMRHAAKIAQAEEFVTKLKDQYDAPISQGGTNVSGGQRQRLAIARALAKQPEILIFDDAFSALDMKTDKKLREDLKSEIQDTVVLIVAQRISTIKEAEQIIVLDQGKMVGKGTHLELLKKCKVYQEIAKSQFSEEEFADEMRQAKEGK
ncbi:ABC transporter ATP-binding protein [Candidatus Saccharibacteria bacterium]|nr:ABC transporter ATP-binding protein [Candidatus Saccharibacteria bacterium]